MAIEKVFAQTEEPSASSTPPRKSTAQLVDEQLRYPSRLLDMAWASPLLTPRPPGGRRRSVRPRCSRPRWPGRRAGRRPAPRGARCSRRSLSTSPNVRSAVCTDDSTSLRTSSASLIAPRRSAVASAMRASISPMIPEAIRIPSCAAASAARRPACLARSAWRALSAMWVRSPSRWSPALASCWSRSLVRVVDPGEITRRLAICLGVFPCSSDATVRRAEALASCAAADTARWSAWSAASCCCERVAASPAGAGPIGSWAGSIRARCCSTPCSSSSKRIGGRTRPPGPGPPGPRPLDRGK